MERIDPIARRDGVEPVRLELLSPLERERERQERERRRRAKSKPDGQPASGGEGVDPSPGAAPPRRLDLRA